MQEIELKFELVNDKNDLFDLLKIIERIGYYDLGNPVNAYENITYFDTETFDIKNIKGCVRLKLLPEGEEIISLKLLNIDNICSEKYFDRMEVEDVASPGTVKKIHDILYQQNVIKEQYKIDDAVQDIDKQIHSWGLLKLFCAKKKE